ncbi:MAG: twin-arginine translocase TatA/TatE family subunit [Lentimicrobiaceae bacterium]|nr:twin-arginine translocase TatA/TatE family subunit [Lentimicrobiaceae bacterium]MCB9024193.1 twin-arginine translocase TatA/TatE family subunit [Lentimicrobiaceae bacterium]MCO5266558.1 twin-arginine translocase TatA/TatE family subunit [Lentimicrobium sp.]
MTEAQLLFLDISGGELLIIFIAAFLIFGPKKMPEIARKLGRTMNELKKASNDITKEFREETNSIKNELLSARESIRRETTIIEKDLNTTISKVENNLSTKPLDDTLSALKDPYGLDKMPDESSGKQPGTE